MTARALALALYVEVRRAEPRHPLGFRPRFRTVVGVSGGDVEVLTPNAYPERLIERRLLRPEEAAAEAAAPFGALVEELGA